MNAGGVVKTCKSNGIFCVAIYRMFSGVRVRNTWAICREVGDSSPKGELIPHVIREDILSKLKSGQPDASCGARGLSASW